MKKKALLTCLAAAVLLLPGCKKYEYPFQNPNLKVDKRVDNLLSLLTPEENICHLKGLLAQRRIA